MNSSEFPNLSKPSFVVDRRAGVIHSPVLDGLVWLSHGVTTRLFAGPEIATFDLVADVRRRLVPGGARIFCCEQVHGNVIEVVRSSERYAATDRARTRGPVVQLLGTDGLIVSDPALPVAIRTADCVPLLLVDARGRRVAAIHAGWRGSFDRISERAVAAMARLGSDPADLVAWMGPAIGRDSYEVGPELSERFRAAFPEYDGIVADNHLDLILLNAYQLRVAGVPGPQIHAANCCTARHLDLCYSYRAERDRTGRMIAHAMILPPEPKNDSK